MTLIHTCTRIKTCHYLFHFSGLSVILSLTVYPLLYYFPICLPVKLYGVHKNIGTTSFNLSADPLTGKPLSVQCWFPIPTGVPLGGSPALLWTSGCPIEQHAECFALLQRLAAMNNIPATFMSHLALTRTNSVYRPSASFLAPELMPIAIYSHGLYGWRQGHHTACERLGIF